MDTVYCVVHLALEHAPSPTKLYGEMKQGGEIMKAGDIVPGTVVKLNSGGPAMTVQSIDTYEALDGAEGALCIWFDTQGDSQERVFPVSALKLTEPDD